MPSLFELPKDVLGTAEQALGIQLTSNIDDQTFDRFTSLGWAVMWSPRLIGEPLLRSKLKPENPLPEPRSRDVKSGTEF